jgi:zinc D-Ala-D-Ala carboxypeptidase
MRMQLSKNFYLSELVHSNTAVRLGIDNTPGEAEIESLRLVAQNILQPIRDHYKIPFSPSSGFRGLELNRLLKSKDSSQHVKGQAVDIELPGISNLDLATWIRDNLSYDQLILEFHTIGEPYSGWVHCSYVQKMARMEVLTFADRKFSQGLIA